MTNITGSKPEKRDAYYIASGFFNAHQIETVDKIEKSLTGLNIKFFSPRSESIEFFKESNSEYKSMMTKLIFNNNLDSIVSCNKFIVNLQDEDQGTLFEYGYIVGKNWTQRNLASFMSRNIKVMHDSTGLELDVMKSFKTENVDSNFISRGKDFTFAYDKLKAYLELKKAVDSRDLIILSIDDRNPINMFLTGYFYARGIPVITYSRKGYGSNVMLVHSTYHCETELELEDLLQELSKENYTEIGADQGTYLSKLRLNKQTWNKTID